MENQSFKSQLKNIVKEYIRHRQRKYLEQKALKERKEKKKKLSKMILGTMMLNMIFNK